MRPNRRAVEGCLLGTAVGDALGLAGEGLSRRRLARLFPGPARMRFLGRRGMVSDDTEHTCCAAQALIASAGEPEAFARALASGPARVAARRSGGASAGRRCGRW